MKAHYIPEHQFPMRISPNGFMLGNYFFNLFLVFGSRYSALFEVGVSGVVDTVIRQLEQLDIQPDFIIPSHPHADHITGVPGLAQRYPRAVIITAQGAEQFMQHPKAGAMMIREDRFISKRLADFGLKPGRPSLDRIPLLDGSLVIRDKTTIDLGQVTLDLIKVNGHSPGNLVGILNPEKILFCSDSLGFHFPGRLFLPLYFTGADEYLSTLDLIKDVNPSMVCPAHQGHLAGQAAVAAIQESMDTARSTINAINRSPLPDDVLANELFEQHYQNEFTIYTADNIKTCTLLMVKRARQLLESIPSDR